MGMGLIGYGTKWSFCEWPLDIKAGHMRYNIPYFASSEVRAQVLQIVGDKYSSKEEQTLKMPNDKFQDMA